MQDHDFVPTCVHGSRRSTTGGGYVHTYGTTTLQRRRGRGTASITRSPRPLLDGLFIIPPSSLPLSFPLSPFLMNPSPLDATITQSLRQTDYAVPTLHRRKGRNRRFGSQLYARTLPSTGKSETFFRPSFVLSDSADNVLHRRAKQWVEIVSCRNSVLLHPIQILIAFC